MRPSPGLTLLVLAACAGDKVDPVDTDADDTDVVADTEVPADTADTDVDTVVVDTDVADTELPDTADTDVCEPFPWEEVMALCGDTPTVVSHWGVPGTEGCPDWWDAGGVTGATVDEALDAAGCDRSCVYRLHQSVLLLYCGSRGEYLRWIPGGQGQVGAGDTCPDWFEVHTVLGGGWFESWEAYQEAFPCPNDTGGDTGDTGGDTAGDTDTDGP